MKDNRGKLLTAVAAMVVLFAGVAAVTVFSDNTDAAVATDADKIFDFEHDVVYGDPYGTSSNADLKNSIGVYFDKASWTYTFYGYLAEQDLTKKEGAFYKLWEANKDFPYGIAFIIKTNETVTINGNGPFTPVGGEEECLLYVNADSLDKKATINVGSKIYYFDLSGLEFISQSELATKQIVNFATLNSGEVVNLTKDGYNVGTMRAKTGDFTLNLNGHNLLTGARLVSADMNGLMNLTINADNGSITASDIIVIAYTEGKLTVNGGTYDSGDYAFVWYADGKENATTASFKNATISGVCGIWLSNKEIDSATITGCDIYAESIGIYLGTAGAKAEGANAAVVVKDTNVTAGNTAIEIKSGDVLIEGCTLHSDNFEVSDAAINNNGSGSGISTLEINNGYVSSGNADAVNVTVNDTIITNSVTSTPVQIVAGAKKSGEAWTSVEADITLTSNCITADQVTMAYYTGTTAEINLKLQGKASTTVDDAQDITDNASSGNALIVNSTIAVESVSITNGTTIIIATGGSYTGDVSIDNTSGVSVAGGTFTGTVTSTSGETENKAKFTEFFGFFKITYGSIAISGTNYYGTVDVSGEVDISGVIGASTGDTGALIVNAAPGTVITIDKDLTVGGEGLVINKDGEGADVNVIVPSGVSVDVADKITLNSGVRMNSDGDVFGEGVITVNDGASFYTSNPVDVVFLGTGTIILEDAMETVHMSGTLSSNFDGTATQNVIIDRNLTIGKNQYVIVRGNLTVPEGVTVTIEDGGLLMIDGVTASADIAGKIVSKGTDAAGVAGFSYLQGEGIVITGEVEAKKAAQDNAVTVRITGETDLQGTVSINTKAAAEFGELNVAETGTVNLR